jgi:hypothetical protein
MTMKITDAGFAFPVFGFEPGETLGWQCDDLSGMVTAREPVFRLHWPKSLELVDANGSRWAVKSTRRTGRSGSLFWWLILAPLGKNRCQIEWDLEPMAPLSLAEVQNLACDTTARFGEVDDWNEELEAETAGEIAKIRATRNIAELVPILNWPSFASY